jgi:hypothetical protein
MLWTIICVLIVLYLVGLLTGTFFGGGLHLLLVVAAVVLLLQLFWRAPPGPPL